MDEGEAFEFDPHEHFDETSVHVLLHHLSGMALSAKKFGSAYSFIRYVSTAVNDKDMSAEGKVEKIKGLIKWVKKAMKDIE